MTAGHLRHWAIAGEVVATTLDLHPVASTQLPATWRVDLVAADDPVFSPWRERLDEPDDAAGPPAWVDMRAEGLVLRFPGHGTFVVEADGSRVALHPDAGLTPFLAHLLVDHVAPRRLAVLGRTVLHATGIALDAGEQRRCLGFFGASGAGKSTIALRFVGRGARFVADDCLCIQASGSGAAVGGFEVRGFEVGGFEVIPSHPGTRLWSDVLDHGQPTLRDRSQLTDWGKHVVGFDDVFSPEPAPLHALVQLVRSDTSTVPTMRRLAPGEATVAVVSTSFLNERGGMSSADLMRRAVALVSSVPVWTLEYPSGFEHLDEAVDTVCRALELPLL